MKRFHEVIQCYLYFLEQPGYDYHLCWNNNEQHYMILGTTEPELITGGYEVIL